VRADSATAASPEKPAKPAVTAGDAKGTFKIPGTEVSLGLGGYAKMDVLYSSVSAGRDKLGDQLLLVSQIPVAGQTSGQHSRINLHAKETRFWLKSHAPTAWGDLNTFIEFDLFNAADAYSLRLRHAYGSFGRLLAGQTWTTLLNVGALPDVLDTSGPVGAFLTRQPMLRWTQPLPLAGAPVEAQFALESPRTRLAADSPLEKADAFGFVHPNAERYPDIIARLNYDPAWGNVSLAAMGRQIRHTASKPATQREAWGGAVSLAGKIKTTGLDNARFILSYGNAFGRYASANTFEDAVLDASSGRLRLVNVYSGMLAYQHWWNNAWRSTLAYGFEQADQPSSASPALTRWAQSVHANLLWSPLLSVTLGLEYIYAERQTVDGRRGDLSRWQFSTRVNF
jgi:hypothetical protein